jgi:uncharacterized protein (DUF362 family)
MAHQDWPSTGISRREFIRRVTALGFTAATASTLFTVLGCGPGGSSPAPLTPSSSMPPTSPSGTVTPRSTLPAPDPAGSRLAVARGSGPRALVEAAVKALGGIEQFVKNGDDVIIKPNICVAYHSFEYAATTNPEVVGTLVALCRGAGARRVRVMDQPFGGTPEQAYARTGIDEAVRLAGGQMEIMSPIKFKPTPLPGAVDIKNWPVYADILAADVVINVPIAKHHSLARLTMGMKNLMGVVQNRNQLHLNLGQRVADLASLVRPSLTVIDGVRILMNHGPTGGDLNDVKMANTVIASRDFVAADSYAATLFNLTGADIPAVRAGAQMGLGTMDLKKARIEEISV